MEKMFENLIGKSVEPRETDYERFITCPNCKYELKDSWEMDDEGEYECDCGCNFKFQRDVDVTYCAQEILK